MTSLVSHDQCHHLFKCDTNSRILIHFSLYKNGDYILIILAKGKIYNFPIYIVSVTYIVQRPQVALSFHFTARFCKPLRLLADGLSALCRSYIIWCCTSNQLYDLSIHPPVLKVISDCWAQDEIYSWGCKSFQPVRCCYYPSVPDKCKVE